MIGIDASGRGTAIDRILCLGAHADDVEIGCGGALLSLLQERRERTVRWVVFSATSARRAEARESARAFLRGAAREQVEIHEFEDGFFPYAGAEIKRCFERLKEEFEPDLVFTHFRDDRHQDHRVVSDLTWNTFRNHWVLEYEIPKYDGDLGAPNFFAPLDERLCGRKVELLCRHFATQRQKHWFDSQTFWSLLRLRGMECRAPQGYAEAFYARKMVWF